MGDVIRFPLPEPKADVLAAMSVPEQSAGVFRMLLREIEADVLKPEKLFLVYGSRWPSRPKTVSWSYIALDFAPDEIVAAVKRVVKDLKETPVPGPPDDVA